MAQSVRDLVARLKAEDSGATANMGKYAAGIAGIGIAVVGAAKALQVMTGAARALTDQVKKNIEAAAVQESAERALGSAIRISGGSAKAALPELKSYASELQDLTGIGDEVILSNQRLLVSVGKLTGDGLKRATKAALDLSVSQGISLRTSFDLVAKAATGYTSTLSRYGIILDESIPASEKFGAALAKIESIAGGAAALGLDTYSGRLAEFQGRVGDLREVLGGPFLEVFKEVLKTSSEFIKGLTDAASKTPSFRNAVIDAAIAVAQFAAISIDAAYAAINFGQSVIAVAAAGFKPFAKLFGGTGGINESLSILSQILGATGLGTDTQMSRAIQALIINLKQLKEEGPEDIGASIDGAFANGVATTQRLNAEIDAIIAKLGGLDRFDDIAGPGATAGDGVDIAGVSQGLLDAEIERIVAHNETIKQAYTDSTVARLQAEAALLDASGQSAIEKNLEILAIREEQELAAAEQLGLLKTEIEDRYAIEREIIAKREADRKIAEEKRVAQEKQQVQFAIARASVNLTRQIFGNTKAAAYATAIINTAEGVTKALSSAPPPYNLILAAITAAAGAAQIATIASTNSQGFAFGGIVGGRVSSPTDTTTVAARPGEAILPPGLTSLLLEAASRTGRNTEVVLELAGDAWDAVADQLTARVRAGAVQLESTRLRTVRATR